MAGIVYTKVDVDIYEQVYESHSADGTEAGANKFKFTGTEAHGDCIGSAEKAKLARIDINGIQTTITAVTFSTPDSFIEVAALSENDRVTAWIPTAGGTLSSNGSTGKLARPYKQIAMNHDVTYDEWSTSGLGVVAKDAYTGAASGTFSFALEKNDGDTLKDFTLAGRNTTYMCVAVKDSHETAAEYTIYNSALLSGHSSAIANIDGERGVMREDYRFTFKPEVEVSTLA
jgi:hypothetical protein